jgi:hypothetical protein
MSTHTESTTVAVDPVQSLKSWSVKTPPVQLGLAGEHWHPLHERWS